MKTVSEALTEATSRLRFAIVQIDEREGKELLRAIEIIAKVREQEKAKHEAGRNDQPA